MVGGGIVSRRPAAFSREGKLLLAPCGRAVHIYSSSTGERVGTLTGHTGEVTCVLLNPENDTQAYSTSLDGTIRLWDVASGACLRMIEVKEAVKSMVVHKDLGVAYLSIQLREGGGGRVLLHNLATGKYSGTAMKTRVAGPLALSPSGSFCATFDRHSLFVWRTGTDIYQPLNLQHTKPYTCLAISSDNAVLAAGDASGRVLIWRSFDSHVPAVRREGAHSGKHHPDSPPPLTTLHWHASPVGSLNFSSDGVYLLSGGAEGVLVMWQLESNRPSFLPRLGGPLVGIHPSPADPARYLLRQSDNCLRVVNLASLKVESSVHGLRPLPAGVSPAIATSATTLRPPASGTGASSAAAGSGALVVPTDNAQLQFYDVLRDRHLGLVRVAPRNQVTLAETNLPSSSASVSGNVHHASTGAGAGASVSSPATAQPVVQHVAFSPDSSVMITVDTRPDAGPFGGSEACLKFWDAAGSGAPSTSASDPFLINTRVDEPHRGGVSALAYHPKRHMAITTGSEDREFKLWVQEPTPRRPSTAAATSASAPSAHWRCRSLAAYRNLPLSAAAFSSEGSVLAVGAGNRVTLWDPESLALAAVMAPPAGAASAQAVAHLAFVGGTPFLVATTHGSVTVYNLLTAAVHWSHSLTVLSLSADPLYPRFAIATPSHPAPVAAPAIASAPSAGAAGEPHAQAPAAVRGREQLGPRAGCTVLVFDPSQPAPKYHAQVPNATHVQVLHMHPSAVDSSPSSSASEPGPSDASPLLLLKDSRQFALALLQGAPAGDALLGASSDAPAPRTQADLLAADAQTVSAFEAAFGALPNSKSVDAAHSAAAAAAAMEVDGVIAAPSVGPKWAQLFDVPSHALPPPSALAQAFLTLLTTAE